MSEIAIQCEGLGKQYRIGKQERYRTLRDTVADTLGAPLRLARSVFSHAGKEKDDEDNTIWALDGASFEIKRGDVVGIIGRNGSGKSTLLKILSRITKPTKGEAQINGRVGSLLEVGTGFHPELTGRENVFLNGAILGMGRNEIERKFDEIVEFAEVSKFIDTPVKRYSSGMYVRLAFAVAAHLESDILLIDEVLAVGDAEFQKKCLGKMNDLGSKGRTVLFVSHNSNAVANLCTRGIILNKGVVRADTSSHEALSLYASELNKAVYVGDEHEDRPSVQKIELDEDALQQGDLRVSVRFSSPFPLDPPRVGIVIYSIHGTPLFGANTCLYPEYRAQALCSGVATMTVKNLPLHSGSYKISVWMGEKNQDYVHLQDALTFDFVSQTLLNGGFSPDCIGALNIPVHWDLVEW